MSDTNDRRAKINYKVASENGSTEFIFEGDARDFASAISHAAMASGGDIRPAAPPPLIMPTMHQQLPEMPVRIADIPQPVFQAAPMPAQLNPSQSPFDLPTLIRDPRIQIWSGRAIGAALIGVALLPLWLIFNSPVAQNNLKKIWSDATIQKPMTPPVKK